MFISALYLARKDFVRMLRGRETIVWTFAMPVIFFYFLGTITNRQASPAAPETLAVSVAPDTGFLADEAIERLKALGYRVARASTPEELARHRRRLEIPAGFTASVLAGKPMQIRFTRVGESLDADYDRIRISSALYTLLGDLVVAGKDGDAVTPEGLAKVVSAPRTLALEVKSAGRRPNPPGGFDQAVPGTMVMFTLLVLFTSGAVTLTIERNSGILRRLASAPTSRGAIVLGKWGARMGLGAIQIAFAMLTGSLVFGVRWGPNLAAVVVILASYGALAAALAMFLGNWGRTEAQVIGLGVIASNVFAALGGCWWPVEVTPLWAQRLALALPTGWAMDALHKLITFGASPAAVIPHLCAMVGSALLSGYLVARRFRFQ